MKYYLVSGLFLISFSSVSIYSLYLFGIFFETDDEFDEDNFNIDYI